MKVQTTITPADANVISNMGGSLPFINIIAGAKINAITAEHIPLNAASTTKFSRMLARKWPQMSVMNDGSIIPDIAAKAPLYLQLYTLQKQMY